MVRIFYNNARAPELQTLTKEREGSWVWVEDPTEQELQALSEKYKLDLDLLMDAVDPNESSRIEREDGRTYIFTRFCVVENQQIITSPLLIIYGDKWIMTISRRHFANLELFTSGKIDFLTTQKTKLMLQILTQVNATYTRQLNQVNKQIGQIRSQLNKSKINNRQFVKFIDIEETLNDFVSALVPMNGMFRSLMTSTNIRFYEVDRDLIDDLTLGTSELIELAKSRLKTITNIREAYSTIMANNLNSVIKLMTALTILMTIPNIVTSAYGMNVSLPLADDPAAFWLLVIIIIAAITLAAWLFRRSKWF